MTPVVVANNGGQVMPGHKLQISTDLLQVKAMGQSSSDVIYTLVPTVNNPRKGEKDGIINNLCLLYFSFDEIEQHRHSQGRGYD